MVALIDEVHVDFNLNLTPDDPDLVCVLRPFLTVS